MSATAGKIKTSAVAVFINTTPTAAAATWQRVRKQSNLSLKYNAETTEDKWIDEDAPSTSVDRYGMSSDGENVCYGNDPLFEYLDGLRINRATGTDCETDMLIVYKYRAKTLGRVPTYEAEKAKCSVQISEFSGEGGGGNMSLSYTINANGDPSKGTASITDGTVEFTEDSTSDTASTPEDSDTLPAEPTENEGAGTDDTTEPETEGA